MSRYNDAAGNRSKRRVPVADLTTHPLAFGGLVLVLVSDAGRDSGLVIEGV